MSTPTCTSISWSPSVTPSSVGAIRKLMTTVIASVVQER